MDLKCVTPANGPSYYRDCLAKVGERRELAQAGANRLQVGDRVSVCLDAGVLEAMAQGHGGWVDDMAQVGELYVPTFPTPFQFFQCAFVFFFSIVFGVCCKFCKSILKVEEDKTKGNSLADNFDLVAKLNPHLTMFQGTRNLSEFFQIGVCFTSFLFNCQIQ